jgi:hypothetical protein
VNLGGNSRPIVYDNSTMEERRLPVGYFFFGLVVIGLAIVGLCYLMIVGSIRSNQRGIERELAAFAADYGYVTNWNEVDRAIDMLDHIQSYYPSIDGSDPQFHADIERQRIRTIKAIAGGLRAFTKQNFDGDAVAWRTWRREHGP